MGVDLTSRTALVTGSTSGMGYAIAHGMAQAGAKTVVHGRSDEAVATTVERIQREVHGSHVIGHSARFDDPESVTELIEAVPDVDILVNNTGPTRSTSLFDMDLKEWREWLDTYLTTGMLLGRHHVPRMIDRGWGRVLYGAGVTCSYSIKDAKLDEMITWLTCKAGMLGLSRSLAEVASNTGVTVNAFIPGPAMTPESFGDGDEDGKNAFIRFEKDYFATDGSSSLIHRFIDPAEIANFAVFLSSNEASALTGSAFRVDGGIIRSIL